MCYTRFKWWIKSRIKALSLIAYSFDTVGNILVRFCRSCFSFTDSCLMVLDVTASCSYAENLISCMRPKIWEQ